MKDKNPPLNYVIKSYFLCSLIITDIKGIFYNAIFFFMLNLYNKKCIEKNLYRLVKPLPLQNNVLWK